MEKVDRQTFIEAVETIELYWFGVEGGTKEKEVLRDVLGTLWGMIRGSDGVRAMLRKRGQFRPQ